MVDLLLLRTGSDIMSRFVVMAKVRQTVDKTVRLVVEASSKEEVEGITRRALLFYPAPVRDLPMIERIVTADASYEPDLSIEVVSINKVINDSKTKDGPDKAG